MKQLILLAACVGLMLSAGCSKPATEPETVAPEPEAVAAPPEFPFDADDFIMTVDYYGEESKSQTRTAFATANRAADLLAWRAAARRNPFYHAFFISADDVKRLEMLLKGDDFELIGHAFDLTSADAAVLNQHIVSIQTSGQKYTCLIGLGEEGLARMRAINAAVPHDTREVLPSAKVLADGFLTMREIDSSLDLIVSEVPTGEGNAADDYRKAIEAYEVYESDIRDFTEEGYQAERDLQDARQTILKELSHLKGEELYAEYDRRYAEALDAYHVDFPSVVDTLAEHVASGAAKADMRYAETYGEELDVHIETRQSSRLFQIAMLLQFQARYQLLKDQPELTIEPMQDLVILGRQMYDEHADAETMSYGLYIQHTSLWALLNAYRAMGDDDALAQMKPYLDEINAIDRSLRDKRNIVWFVLAQDAHPADIYYIIEHDEDPAWRQRAVLTLGILKFVNVSDGARAEAEQKIAAYCESDDPAIRAAAETARDFDRGGFNRLGVSKYPG